MPNPEQHNLRDVDLKMPPRVVPLPTLSGEVSAQVSPTGHKIRVQLRLPLTTLNMERGPINVKIAPPSVTLEMDCEDALALGNALCIVAGGSQPTQEQRS